jgi:PIN domain nuclease of toxin-antitoxin system
MRYLIDTHTFLWFNGGSNELSLATKELISDRTNKIFVSIISLWEISIKTSIGKLAILDNYELIMEDIIANSIEILPVNFAHTVIQIKLPFYHKDPFDRIIISQAIHENMDIISKDTIFDDYLKNEKIKRIW